MEGSQRVMVRCLAQGRYPSHVTQLLDSAYPLDAYEMGLQANGSLFCHGGEGSIAELPGGAGIRAMRKPFKDKAFVRILSPCGGWLGSETLELLADLADRYAEAHIHLATGGAMEMYLEKEQVIPLVRELNRHGLDVGSTGDGLRCIVSCCGPIRCEYGVVDASALATYLGRRFIGEQQYPSLPHKCKTAVSGCRHDCSRVGTQKDHGFIGVFRDTPVVDRARLQTWVEAGGSLAGLAGICPAAAIRLLPDGDLLICGQTCRRCMRCVGVCPAIRPGLDKGVAWVVGGKYGNRGPQGPMPGDVLISFLPVKNNDFTLIGNLYGAFLELWDTYAREKERIGDFVRRFGRERVLQELRVQGVLPEKGGDGVD